MVADFLWDEGKIVGLIERRCDQDRRSRQMATIRDGQLFTLNDEPIGLYLQHLERGQASAAKLVRLRAPLRDK